MTATYFDTHREQMASVVATEGNQALCYDRQAAIVDGLIRPGMTVLDVGCGASLPYRADGAYVIGLDPSEASLAQNTDVDERIVGSALDIPLADASVDLVVMFYALHHVTTDTTADTGLMRIQAFKEMTRVLKPGGEILVFEMTPPSPVWWAEYWLWDVARRRLGAALDTLFWPDYVMDLMAWFADIAPSRKERFDCSPFTLIAPIIGLPWMRIPRFLFPLTPTLYRWSKP